MGESSPPLSQSPICSPEPFDDSYEALRQEQESIRRATDMLGASVRGLSSALHEAAKQPMPWLAELHGASAAEAVAAKSALERRRLQIDHL
jgi:hypothetical protein